MALTKKPYKGTRDFFPVDKRKQDYIFGKMKEAAHAFGYQHYDGPLLEELDLYRAKSGDELVTEQVYSFTDRGNREVAIRPEMTPTVARMVAQIHREVAKPIRWYSIPNLMRYERPQKGRLREHWQFNVDVFGGPENESVLEIFAVAVHFLKSFGATSEHFEILINNRVVVEYFFKYLELNEEKSYQLIKLIDRYKKLPKEKFEQSLKDLELGDETKEQAVRDYLEAEGYEKFTAFLKKINFDKSLWDYEMFWAQLEAFKIQEYIKFDPSIVRGLDYYTGVVFEIFDKNPENRRAISGGGAYANLLKIFGEAPLPGVGFGLGDVTLSDFLVTHKLMPNLDKPENDIVVTFQSEKKEALQSTIELSQELRSKGLKVVSSLEQLKFKKAFAMADSQGAKYIALLGDSELEASEIAIKRLSDGTQEKFKLSDLNSITNFLS